MLKFMLLTCLSVKTAVLKVYDFKQQNNYMFSRLLVPVMQIQLLSF